MQVMVLDKLNAISYDTKAALYVATELFTTVVFSLILVGAFELSENDSNFAGLLASLLVGEASGEALGGTVRASTAAAASAAPGSSLGAMSAVGIKDALAMRLPSSSSSSSRPAAPPAAGSAAPYKMAGGSASAGTVPV